MTIAWQPADPLARVVPGEGKRANAALREYAEQPRDHRSYRLLIAEFIRRKSGGNPAELPPTTSMETLKTWAINHEWQARIARYDEIEIARQTALRADAERAENAKWAVRRAELREREWAQAATLTERAATMLKTPLFTTKTDGGQTIITPARWSWGDIPRIAETASKLARLAAELPTDRASIEFAELSDADLTAALAAALGAALSPDPGGAAPQPGSADDYSSGADAGAGTDALPG